MCSNQNLKGKKKWGGGGGIICQLFHVMFVLILLLLCGYQPVRKNHAEENPSSFRGYFYGTFFFSLHFQVNEPLAKDHFSFKMTLFVVVDLQGGLSVLLAVCSHECFFCIPQLSKGCSGLSF